MKLFIHTDGGARGNPGPGAIGVAVLDEKKKVIKEIGKYIGKSTNNEAEYKAVLEGLRVAKDLKGSEIIFYSAVCQIQGCKLNKKKFRIKVSKYYFRINFIFKSRGET